MASLQVQVEAVRNAVASPTSCTPATVVSLKSLLLPPDADSKPHTSTSTSTSRTTSRAAASRPHTAMGTTRPGTAASKRRPAARPAAESLADQLLSPKEKAQLATHVVNATLKALAEASKPRPAPTQTPKEPQTPACPPDTTGADDVSKTTRRLRRSMSAPLMPMQPRPLNRVPTSPVKSAHTAAHTTTSAHHATYLATVECARVAFVTLRTVQDSGHVALPELQLEAGMSSFVAKLLGLGMLDQACRELRVLKTRLQGSTSARSATAKPAASASKTSKTTKTKSAPKETTGAAVEPATSPSDLLDFDVAGASTATLRLIVATQIQVLRVLVALKKPSCVDAALPFLRRGCKSSPLQNLIRYIQFESPAPAEQQKALRQVETLSQLLLALAPSISSKDDATALEPKLSVSPATALELQTLSLEVRLWHWKLSGQTKADADKDILQPFGRCLSAYARRSRSSGRPSYSLCRQCFEHVQELMHANKHATARSCRSPIANVYQTLTAVARETGRLDDAIHWANQLCSFINTHEDSAARCCSYSAQLLALQLKNPELPVKDSHKLLSKVLEAIKGPLKGDTAELEELLVNVCQVRKAAMNLLILHARSKDSTDDDDGAATRQVMEAFIYQCPRFCLRWLGKPPAAKSSTKDFLRYEQRRQLLSQSIRPTLDSAFVVTKTMIEENRMVWDQLDSVLGDALTVLEYLGDLKSTNDAASSYYVKISHFYYLSYNALRRSKESEMDALKSLRRAIDCVKHRSGPEKSKAQLIPKLERIADLCRSMGQIGEALGALQSIRTSLVDDGALTQVVKLLQTQPPSMAWTSNDQVEALERSLTTISRLEQVPIDWTGGLDDEERAAVLEHQLCFVCLGKSSGKSAATPQRLILSHPCIEALLGIYSPTQFPIRRLRTLLRVFAANLDTPEVLADITLQIQQVLEHIDSQGLADDAALEGYLTHYRTLAKSLAGFSEGYSDVQGLESCLATWKTLLQDKPTRTDLEQAIDSISDWQTHLQSVAEFMRAMGRDTILTAVLELSSRLCSVLSEAQEGDDASSHRVQLAHDIMLASHYVRVGECLKAEEILGRVGGCLQESQTCELAETVASFHLSYAEYLIAVGRLDEAHDHLIEAKPTDALVKLNGTQKKILGARASVMESIVALDKGDAHLALQTARGGVRMLFHDWSRLEKLMTAKGDDEHVAAADSLVDLGSTLRETTETEVSLVTDASPAVAKTAASPEFWTLFHPLFEAMQRLSTVYAHLGMFQETLYYAEQAQKIATATNGAWALAQSEAWLSTVWLRAAKPEKALGLVGTARSRMAEMDQTSRKAALACELGGLCREMKDDEGEKEMLQLAESIIEGLSIGPAAVEEVVEAPPDKGRKTRAGRRPKTPAPRRKAAATPVAPAPPVVKNAIVTELRAAMLVNQVLSLVDSKDWTAALELLRADGLVSKRRAEILAEQVALAACLLGHSTEQMANDAVFSVIQDSTLSFPAVSVPGRTSTALEPKGKASASASASSKTAGHALAFVEGLLEAQNRLIEAQTMAAQSGDAGTLLRISRMLQSAVITLSATSWSLPRAMGPPAYATCSVELARNMTWRRERRALLVEKTWADSSVESTVVESAVDRRASLGLSASDISRFQRDYIDIIPPDWSVVSLALTENDQDLCITKFQAGQSPFVIRLPLEREISRDADTEVFRFQQGRAELLEIIAATNTSCHDARDMTVKGAKAAWWAERTALDDRLRELLENVEQIWLGGFRGIFSQHVRRAEPFARFEKTFQTILDKHLPSRRTVRGKRGGRTAAASSSNASNNRVSLDGRTLDLFIGLGDATEEGCDFDDVLNDLLYFVVDILQFHGERNAYDEIDFDAMVIETFDALYAYHSSVRELTSGSGDGGDSGDSDPVTEKDRHAHTILVLDKSLHVFPWEAMPCLQGTAVSRVPSLACLRDLLGKAGSTARAKAGKATSRPGHYASAADGAYMLNPSGDLSSTETTFDGPLSASVRGSWTRIVSRAPTEDEFEAVLRDKDVLLYFGHGSGAQYIRGRTVRRLERCRATALLMGCSSAGLDYNGDFELHGPVWNYMLAGCPAVVGTLWDVTDKDIDRFAGRTFEEWGLLPRGSFEKAGGRKRAGKSIGTRSLVEAVMRAREAPRFRYLTAAAVCVYGIPVYLE